MKQAVVLHHATGLSGQLATLQETHSLTQADTERIQLVVQEYRTNLVTIDNLLKFGLSVLEIAQVYNARDRINGQLSSSKLYQTVSLKQLVRFQQQFRSESLDADALVERVVGLHERFHDRYLDHMLHELTKMSRRHPGALPESLADLMAGSSEFFGDEDE